MCLQCLDQGLSVRRRIVVCQALDEHAQSRPFRGVQRVNRPRHPPDYTLKSMPRPRGPARAPRRPRPTAEPRSHLRPSRSRRCSPARSPGCSRSPCREPRPTRRQLHLDPTGWTHRQDMVSQLDRPVDLAVDDEVLAPLDIALDDDSPPDPGDALGSLRAASTLSARRRRTADRSIVSKRCLDHFEATSIHPGDPFMRRRRPLLHPRSAPPAPSGTTSAAPTRTPGTRPLGNHPSSAPGRTATGARSRGAGTPGPRTSAPASVLSARLEPLGQPAAQDRLDPAVADGRQPACRRPATGRRRRTPHSRAPSGPPDPATGTPTTPTAAAGPPPATRPRTARPSTPPGAEAVQPRSTSTVPSAASTRCTGYSAAPNSSRCRSAASTSAVVAARNPPPSSTSSANSPRPRPPHAPATFRHHPSERAIAVQARSHLPFGPPERSQPAKPRTGTARLTHTFDDAGVATSSASCSDQLRVRVAFGQLDQLPQDAVHDEAQVTVPASGSATDRMAAGAALHS